MLPLQRAASESSSAVTFGFRLGEANLETKSLTCAGNPLEAMMT